MGAALDVFDEEPLPQQHPLRSMSNVILSPHMGYVTQETYAKFYGGSLENILAYLGGEPTHVINTEVLEKISR